jgi:hypothetical protein
VDVEDVLEVEGVLVVEDCLGVVEEVEVVVVEEELEIDDIGFPGPQEPVLTIVVFVPPVVPSLVRFISSQKSLRTIFCVCETITSLCVNVKSDV